MALQSSCAAGLATKKKEDKDSSLRGFFPTSAAFWENFSICYVLSEGWTLESYILPHQWYKE